MDIPSHESASDVVGPLSVDQEGRLFLESWLNMRSAPYLPFHLHAGLMLTGELDVPALEAAFNHVVGRHDVLRTAFLGVIRPPVSGTSPNVAGERPRVERPGRDGVARSTFRQTTVPHAPLALTVESLEHVAPADRVAEIQRIAGELVTIPFDYEKPPLLRAVVLRLHRTEHALIIVLHHLVGDGWSLGILANEVATAYASLSKGAPSSLRALPAQFADFAKWQRRRLQGDALDRLAAHVAKSYRDFDSVQASCHDLPFAGPRGGPIRRGGCETLDLSRAVS